MRPSGSVVQHLPLIEAEHDDHHRCVPDRAEFLFPAVPADDQGGESKSEDAHDPVHSDAVSKDHDIQSTL